MIVNEEQIPKGYSFLCCNPYCCECKVFESPFATKDIAEAERHSRENGSPMLIGSESDLEDELAWKIELTEQKLSRVRGQR